MRPQDLSEAQLRKLLAQVDLHLDYWNKVWKRCKANGISRHEPFGENVCIIWGALARHRTHLEQLLKKVPQAPTPTSTKLHGRGADRGQPTETWAEWKKRQASDGPLP